MESHEILVQNMPYLSPNTSSFTKPLLSEIISQGLTSVPTSTYRKSTSDLNSTLISSFPSKISSEKPISDPPYDTSVYQSTESSSYSLPSSRLPSISPTQELHANTCPNYSSPPSLLLSATPSVIPGTSPSDMPSLLTTLVPS